MNEFEELTKIKNNQHLSVAPPSEDLKKIASILKSEHNQKNVFGQVTFNFDPLLFRSEAIDFQKLIADLSEKYGLIFEVPDIIQLEMKQDGGIGPKTFHRVLRSREGLNFKHGLVSYEQSGDNTEVIIRQVNIHSQNITVALDGSTDQAEVIAQKIIMDLLENQGLNYSWSEFKSRIGGISYKSTTQLDLGFEPLELFSSEMKRFVSMDLQGDLGYKMADKPLDGPKTAVEDLVIKCAVDEVKFKISIFNKLTGDQDYFDFRLDVGDRRHRGTGYVVLTSQLNHEHHLQGTYNLIEKIRKP